MGQRVHGIHLFGAVFTRLQDLKQGNLGIAPESIWAWAKTNLPQDFSSAGRGVRVTIAHEFLKSPRGVGVGTSALGWPSELDDGATRFVRQIRPQLHPDDEAGAQLRTMALLLVEQDIEVRRSLLILDIRPEQLVAALAQ